MDSKWQQTPALPQAPHTPAMNQLTPCHPVCHQLLTEWATGALATTRQQDLVRQFLTKTNLPEPSTRSPSGKRRHLLRLRFPDSTHRTTGNREHLICACVDALDDLLEFGCRHRGRPQETLR